MTKKSLLLFLFFIPITLFSESSSLKEEMINKTGLPEGHFLIQGFLSVNREEYLPKEFQELSRTAIDIPLGSQILGLSPVTLINIFVKGGLKENHRVLLVGNQCSYPATALSRAGMDVYVIDPTAPASSSYLLKKDLNDLKGWISMAPFDFILLINKPSESVPTPLIKQLSSEGILIIPLITPSYKQSWVKIKAVGSNLDISIMDSLYTLPLF